VVEWGLPSSQVSQIRAAFNSNLAITIQQLLNCTGVVKERFVIAGPALLGEDQFTIAPV
jgi:hypothetical protein